MCNFYDDAYYDYLNNIIYDNKYGDDNYYGGDNFDDTANDGEPDDCCCD